MTLNYTTVVLTKTVWYWSKNRHVHQWDKVEDLEKPPHTVAPNVWQRLQKHDRTEDSLASRWVLGRLDPYLQKGKLDLRLLPRKDQF